MKNFFQPLLATLFLINCSNYNYDNILPCVNIAPNSTINNLVVLSDKGCGYCKVALSELQYFKFNDALKIKVIEFGKGDLAKLKNAYPDYYFIDPGQCNYKGIKPDFFPQFFLFDKNDKLVWKKKGWFAQNLKDIEKELK